MKRYGTTLAIIVLMGALGVSGCRRAEQPVAPAAIQQPKHYSIVIFNLLSHPILDDSVKGIKDGLREGGFDAKQLTIRDVNANGEMSKLDAFAQEVVASNPDLVIPVSTPVTQAVIKAARPQQRIVFSTVTNPADVGMDKHPANLTGVSDSVNYAANLDLIAELFPKAKRIGIIYNPAELNSQFGVEEVKKLAPQRNLEVKLVPVSRSDEVADATRALVRQVDVIYVGSDNTVVSGIGAVLKTAYSARIPVIASDSGSVEQGALAAVSVDYSQLGHEVARIAGELLRSGKAAGSSPNVIFVGKSLLLNRKAAGQLGYEFPDAVVKRAAKIIG